MKYDALLALAALIVVSSVLRFVRARWTDDARAIEDDDEPAERER